ncbi:hypothetical protein [Lewinella sp. 4G2]|uniref:hypothetical protein n=1 Tax=Lewinella sp. 4G2 TaxID=1803372 RepID=UPI0007B4C93B|nr:hypothetical protein [Lewinella sp. 4G2]OAV46055.1 hypothetical protein A3850_017475 [Lewinella sp. 4G2]
MKGNYKFTKFPIEGDTQESTAAELLELLDTNCRQNGLLPTDNASDAHFVALVMLGEANWVHFDSKGHYQALDETDYLPVIHDLSKWRDSVTCWVYGKHGYTLRRYHLGHLKGQWANLNATNEFDSMDEAEDWLPRFENWKDLVQEDVTEQTFYQSLPPPTVAGSPVPTYSTPPAEIPQRIANLFGWDERFNDASVVVDPANSPDLVRFGYRSATGDYANENLGVRTFVRCYAHPDPQDRYSRHWNK